MRKLILIPMAFALVHGLRRLGAGGARRAFVAVVGAFVVLEQSQSHPAFEVAPLFERARQIASFVPADCDSFLYTLYRPQLAPRGRSRSNLDQQYSHVLAMWAALQLGKPTLNGYSGFPPPDWTIWPSNLVLPGELDDQRQGLGRWILKTGLENETVCWVITEFGGGEPLKIDVERF